MYLRSLTKPSTADCSAQLERLAGALNTAEAVLVGAGAGLSVSAGFRYDGPRFTEHFSDFQQAYGIRDMYSGGFYPFRTPEEFWAWWSRHIYLNRYAAGPGKPYLDLLELVRHQDYFVLTTNVDHQFQLSGFDRKRLFYTQGDYGLWQCERPCHLQTYDNESAVREMVARQERMRVPTSLVPRCPRCGAPMTMNLRTDEHFVEDDGWRAAHARYDAFLRAHRNGRLLLLELGVGLNTPGVVKLPFWQIAAQNPGATYACLNLDAPLFPREIEARSILLQGDIAPLLERCLEAVRKGACRSRPDARAEE